MSVLLVLAVSLTQAGSDPTVQFDAATITAFFAGLAVLITAIGTVILQLRQVHKVVNSNFEEQREEIAALREALGDTPAGTKASKARQKVRDTAKKHRRKKS